MAKDPEWYYPFNYAPSLRDLANFMTGGVDTATFTENFTVPASRGFVSPSVQLLCIMPRDSAPVLPRKIATIMTDTCGPCAHMFPIDFNIQTYMKMHLWECTPILPTLDVALFDNIVKDNGHTK
jgi:5'-3' exonuclease